MSVFSGDFLGFQLGDIHSSQLNITRVSNNNRYSEDLISNFTDSTVVVPGGDGTYYWDTFYTKKPFIIDFAFDDLRDEDIRRLRQIFGFKGVKKLIFDETPYKYYMVKCSAPPIIKYIAFDQNGIKVYKGEGSINLVAYYPYGIATKQVVIPKTTTHKIINRGDLATGLKIYYTTENINNLSQIKLLEDENIINELNFSNVEQLGNDKYICIDTRTHLIEGLDQTFAKTGNLYNKFKTTGDFFELPVGVYKIDSNIDFEKIEFSSLYY